MTIAVVFIKSKNSPVDMKKHESFYHNLYIYNFVHPCVFVDESPTNISSRTLLHTEI